MVGGIVGYLSVFCQKILSCKAPFFPSRRELALAAWLKCQGDKTYRLNYELSEQSIVFDLGGFEGQWTSDVFAMYMPRIHVFEPVDPFFAKIKHRFRNNPKITVHPFGLAKEDTEARIYLDNDGSSAFQANGRPPTLVKMVKAASYIEAGRFGKIDLMKINIEGGEYDLLEHLLESKLISRVGNIQVQFHDFVPHAKARMKSIQQRLAVTHELTYHFEFVWENWAIRQRA